MPLGTVWGEGAVSANQSPGELWFVFTHCLGPGLHGGGDARDWGV